MIYVLCGASSSGKDYIMKYMVKNHNIKPIISYTTRPIRDGEIDGIEYHFVNKDKFITFIDNDLLIEYRTYDTLVDGIPDTWYYGLYKQQFSNDNNYVVILDIQGTNDFIKYYGKDKCKVIYVSCDDNVRKERAQLRGSFNLSEWNRRIKADRIDFSYDKLVDIVDKFVDNTNSNVEDIVGEILNEN